MTKAAYVTDLPCNGKPDPGNFLVPALADAEAGLCVFADRRTILAAVQETLRHFRHRINGASCAPQRVDKVCFRKIFLSGFVVAQKSSGTAQDYSATVCF
ncbi:MAG: hypothetical protein Q8J78_04260 [Moraxellaceae bacterium]|nr:hypothetical protein [Moraxellaceae bacterium]